MEREISGLLRQIARQDVVEIGPGSAVGRMAALVHVAERYGFEYGQSIRTGHKKTLVLARMYRDPSPRARTREAATVAAYPAAGNGGAVRGMRKGTLRPLPEARDAVARTKDRIMFDVLSSHAADTPRKVLGYGMCAVLALVLLVSGKPLVALVVGGVLAAFLTGAYKLGEIRRQQITGRLTAAGFVPVQDGSGRPGFLRPGQQLPAHTDPFAS
ncbi:hypothetical protein [Streptomyces sp. XY66]|uniref:hypothetical protein n=1 Tax=Streptomyces sp. XY66 TaxID=1415563 RepID=UPI0006AF47B7|nr:hypothetical protein [Streptomyces sp. XY66]